MLESFRSLDFGVGGIVLIVLVLIFFSAMAAEKAAEKRNSEIKKWIAKYKWSFSPAPNREMFHQFHFLNHLSHGENRYCFDTFQGDWKGFDAIAFGFHFETYDEDDDGETEVDHHYLSVIALKIEKSFPELLIEPEGWLTRLGQFFGAQDIDFESVEFSNTFAVHSEDKKFAYDFCNTGMMEYLLQHPEPALELESDIIAIYFHRILDPADLEPNLDHLVNIRRRMPEFLFRI